MVLTHIRCAPMNMSPLRRHILSTITLSQRHTLSLEYTGSLYTPAPVANLSVTLESSILESLPADVARAEITRAGRRGHLAKFGGRRGVRRRAGKQSRVERGVRCVRAILCMGHEGSRKKGDFVCDRNSFGTCTVHKPNSLFRCRVVERDGCMRVACELLCALFFVPHCARIRLHMV